MANWIARPKAPPAGIVLLIVNEVCRMTNAGL